MDTKFSPVDPDFYEVIEREKSKGGISTVNYFGPKEEILGTRDVIDDVFFIKNYEAYLVFERSDKIRLDRIITINGKPGPAYDEYDSFANSCLSCMGGMD